MYVQLVTYLNFRNNYHTVGNVKWRDHLEDVYVDERIILKLEYISDNYRVRILSEFIWLRIRFNSALLLIRQSNFWLQNRRKISWLAEQVLASQEGPCSMDLLNTKGWFAVFLSFKTRLITNALVIEFFVLIHTEIAVHCNE
jgi:hypothetical protein